MLAFLQSLIPALVAVVPSYFLYRQNRESSIRERVDRQEERSTEARRLEHDTEVKRLELTSASEDARVERERAAFVELRQSVLRFTSAVQGLRFDALSLLASEGGDWSNLLRGRQQELTEAYEEAILLAHGGSLENALIDAFGMVEAMYSPGFIDMQRLERMPRALAEVRNRLQER